MLNERRLFLLLCLLYATWYLVRLDLLGHQIVVSVREYTIDASPSWSADDTMHGVAEVCQ